MGGKALKKLGIETIRLNKEDYDRTVNNLFKYLYKLFPKSKFHVVRSFKEKKDFGDVDIIVTKYKDMPSSAELVKHEFMLNTKGYIKNGNVTSFEYENFQIDLIFTSEKNFETTKDFMDFDPCGNLMGKISHKFGVKYGNAGLTYPYRGNSGMIIKDIIISKDSKRIFEFLGMNYEQYLQEFDTKKEIFDYIINSKYFNFDIFKFENLNHIDKKRNSKRPTYNEFPEYVNNIKHKSSYIFNKDKDYYIDYIELMFPECKLIDQLTELKKRSNILHAMHSKFNGKLIMNDIPYLCGKLLSKQMREFKEQIGTDKEYEKYILSTSSKKIMSDFRLYHISTIIVKK